MAMLRALPSISTLLNQPRKNFASRASLSHRLFKHVKLSSVRRNARQIQGLGNEESVCESFADGGQDSEIFTDEARISNFFADEARVFDSFPDEVRVSQLFGAGFLERFARENVEVLGNERRISERFIDGVRVSSSFAGILERFVRENARELAICTLMFALVCLPDERALANGGGPVMEEFWDNVRRYGFYFFTVVSGALYSLAKPLIDLLRDPSTQVLVLIVVLGTFYLLYLTVSTMLGLNEFQYEYAQ